MKFRFLLITYFVATRALSGGAWDSYEFDLPSQAPEAAWRDALADELGGDAEVPFEGGRIDVLTDDMAIELDWPHKWHEGLGQALHYADVSNRQGVLALIVYGQGPDRLQVRTRKRLETAERTCSKNNVKLLVLFPTLPRDQKTELQSRHDPRHWLSRSGIRHNEHCRHFQTTGSGRACTEQEGRACALCGG